jgi:tetratricopeptide (TPR) repeat protein
MRLKVDKTKQHSNFSFFKKIYVIIALIVVIVFVAIIIGSQTIGFIGVIIGVILGGYQVILEILKAEEKQKEVKIQLSVADSFFERFEYEKAIKEYEKALELDIDNIEAHSRIITAATKKLELEERLPGRVWNTEEATKEADNILARIYRVYVLNPSLKDDIELLLEEALLLKLSRRYIAGITVLEKAKKLFPDNPTMLAELGCLHALASPDKNIEGLDLLRRAIEIRPTEARYHYYLARAVEKAGLHAEAISQYYQAIQLQLATGLDLWSKKICQGAFEALIRFFEIYFPWGEEFTKLDMPLEERIHILEFIMVFRSHYHSGDTDPYLHLAILYYKDGEFKKANNMIQEFMKYWKIKIEDNLPVLELYANILEQGGIDPDTLNKVRIAIKARYDEEQERKEKEKYYDILETNPFSQPFLKIKIGLKTPSEASDNGVLVLRAYEGYPFAKAGICEGDRIIEFAHREVQDLNYIINLFAGFKPGTDVPVKVNRNGNVIYFTLVIEYA